MQTNRRRNEAILVALLQILHLTSPTLQTLHMSFQSRWNIIPAHLFVWILAGRIRSMPVLTVRYYALFHAGVEDGLVLDDGAVAGTSRSARIHLIYTNGRRRSRLR
jgi:hypothetical protein